MTNKMKVYPNTKQHKVFAEFNAGKHPSELVEKYDLKYNTLQQYYHKWKKTKKQKDNPLTGLQELIKDIHSPSIKDNKPIVKHSKTVPKVVEHIENNKTVEVKVPPEKKIEIKEWIPIEKKVERVNPFQ